MSPAPASAHLHAPAFLNPARLAPLAPAACRWSVAKLGMEHPASVELVSALEDALLACLTAESGAEKPTAQAVSSIWWALPGRVLRRRVAAACSPAETPQGTWPAQNCLLLPSMPTCG